MVQDVCARGQSLLQAAVFCLGMVGCAAQHDDALRLSEELGRARADAAWQQTRAAELESRVSRLEQRATEAARVRSAEDDKLLTRLDHLIEINQSLLAARTAGPDSEGPSATPPQTKATPVKGTPAASNARSETPATSPTPSQEQQLRALVEGLRGRPGRLHGNLTREQEGALRVLLRTERTLDAENPWPVSIY